MSTLSATGSNVADEESDAFVLLGFSLWGFIFFRLRLVGAGDGTRVGAILGEKVGVVVGASVGAMVGSIVGITVGDEVAGGAPMRNSLCPQ